MAEARFVPRKLSAGVILVDPEGRVLLQLRDDDLKIMFPGCWGITGGAGQPGETPEQIARREVTEETGLTLGRIDPFRAYYFTEEKVGAGKKRSGTKASADYELYLYHAPCDTPADDMVCGEGRGLRFFAPHELPTLDIAYNHRDVLTEFFASPMYQAYLRGIPFDAAAGEQADAEPLEQFRAAIAAGDPWFDAVLRAIAMWERPGEEVDGRQYRYLVGGEAFDWLLLAERLIEDAGAAVPEDQAERLLFEARPPVEMDEERLRDGIGASKHRAHLNYLYGVIVEEALQYAVELEVTKEQRTVSIDDGLDGEPMRDPIYQRIYGRTRTALLREFRAEMRLPRSAAMSLTELREFLYWLFRCRVRECEPARVASDTRKALAQLSAIENAARRSRRVRQGAAPPDEADVLSGVG